jgi:hypothetical protein
MDKWLWAFAIAVLSVVMATVLFRLLQAQGAVFALLLIWSIGLLAGLVAWVTEIRPAIGAAGGLMAGLFVTLLLAVTIAAAPLAPDATRPGFRDLLWTPLLGLIGVLLLCAVSGWYGVRAGRYIATRRKA